MATGLMIKIIFINKVEADKGTHKAGAAINENITYRVVLLMLWTAVARSPFSTSRLLPGMVVSGWLEGDLAG